MFVSSCIRKTRRKVYSTQGVHVSEANTIVSCASDVVPCYVVKREAWLGIDS